jgi:hypothetical protein
LVSADEEVVGRRVGWCRESGEHGDLGVYRAGLGQDQAIGGEGVEFETVGFSRNAKAGC